MLDDKNTLFDKRHHLGDESHLLREIVRTHQVLMGRVARHLGMPASQFILLRSLAKAETAVGIMDLARALGVNAAAITRQVQALESEGLILRRPDERDKRRQCLRLSAKGRKLFEETHAKSHKLERALSQVVPAADISTTAATLRQVREFIETYQEEEKNEAED